MGRRERARARYVPNRIGIHDVGRSFTCTLLSAVTCKGQMRTGQQDLLLSSRSRWRPRCCLDTQDVRTILPETVWLAANSRVNVGVTVLAAAQPVHGRSVAVLDCCVDSTAGRPVTLACKVRAQVMGHRRPTWASISPPYAPVGQTRLPLDRHGGQPLEAPTPP